MWAATGLSVRWWPIVAVEGKRNKEVNLSVGMKLKVTQKKFGFLHLLRGFWVMQ